MGGEQPGSTSPGCPKPPARAIHNHASRLCGGPRTSRYRSACGPAAVYGQLRAQRLKTLSAIETLTGQNLNRPDTSLADLDLRSLLAVDASFSQGAYNEDQFLTYAGQQMLAAFHDERSLIRAELAKIVAAGGSQREVIYGYMTKNKPSAFARQVGGVCVAQDVPRGPGSRNIWDMPEYFQFVLQDPETFRCLGLCLFHRYEEQGQKILAVSLNPSNTYVKSVDERALFQALLANLVAFARANGFAKIVASANTAIRTNRTGGEFENSLKDQIAAIGQTFSFAEPKVFSYSPHYDIQAMDVLWQQPATTNANTV